MKILKIRYFVLHVIFVTLVSSYLAYIFHRSDLLIYVPILSAAILIIGVPVIKIRNLKVRIKFVLCLMLKARFSHIKEDGIEEYDKFILQRIEDSGIIFNYKDLLEIIDQNHLYKNKAILRDYIHSNAKVKYKRRQMGIPHDKFLLKSGSE